MGRAEWQCGYCQQKRLYERRNCKKFPNLVQIDRKAVWAPTVSVKVQTGDKTEMKQSVIKGYKTGECPTSLITGQSLWLLELVENSAAAVAAGGDSLMGRNSARWPAWFLDAVNVIERVSMQWKAAEVEAQYGRA